MTDRRALLTSLVEAKLVRQAHHFHTTVRDLAHTLVSEGRGRRGRRVSLADQRPLRRRWARTAGRCGFSTAFELFVHLDLLTPEGRTTRPIAPEPARLDAEERVRRLEAVRERVRAKGHPDFV